MHNIFLVKWGQSLEYSFAFRRIGDTLKPNEGVASGSVLSTPYTGPFLLGIFLILATKQPLCRHFKHFLDELLPNADSDKQSKDKSDGVGNDA
jgi:hypothetical protein